MVIEVALPLKIANLIYPFDRRKNYLLNIAEKRSFLVSSAFNEIIKRFKSWVADLLLDVKWLVSGEEISKIDLFILLAAVFQSVLIYI